MERLALETVEAGKIGNIVSGQDTDRSDQKPRAWFRAVLKLDLPAIRGFIIFRCDYTGVELDIAV